MSWSNDYKKSIDCKNPKGFSQKAHCAARKKRQRGEETKSMSPFNEDVQSVKKIKFSKFTHKTPHLKGGQHVLDPNVDLKQLVHHATVQYLDRDADGDIDIYDASSKKTPDENVMSAPGEAQKRSLKLIAKQKGEMLHTKRGSAFEGVEMRYCKLCRKMEARTDCSYGPTMWDKYSVAKVHPANEAKDHEYSMARSELSTIVNGAKRLQKKMKKGEGEIEAWVQSKITKAADYIDSAADYVDSGEMNKEEVEILEGKRDGKSAKDPGYSLRDWFKGGGWVQAGGKYDGKPCAKQPGQKTKPFCRDADDRAAMSKSERTRRAAKKRKEDPNPNRSGKAKFVSASYEPQGQQLDELWGKVALGAGAMFIPYLLKKFAKPAVDKVINEPATGSGTLVDKLKQKRDTINQMNSYELQGEVIDEAGKKCWKGYKKAGTQTLFGKTYNRCVKEEVCPVCGYDPCECLEGSLQEKKDACYHKVKSRYKVWPSAYASGALVKCRKVGADSWGTKSESTDALGYDWDTPIRERPDRYCPKCEKLELRNECKYGTRYWDMFSLPAELIGSKKEYNITMPYAGNVKEKYQFSNWREELAEDWQKVNRQDKTDGLSPAAVKAYRRENPGSKLQTAVTEKKPKGKRAKRRASFCRRMKGMKSKLTSAKTARDPDSRINKALRRWRCN